MSILFAEEMSEKNSNSEVNKSCLHPIALFSFQIPLGKLYFTLAALHCLVCDVKLTSRRIRSF